MGIVGIGRSVAVLSLAAALLIPGADVTSQDVALESFHGRWIFNDSSADRRQLESGIDRVVDQLNIFIREIARGEIRRRITAEQRIDIYVTGEETIAITFDAWGPNHYTLGASPVDMRNAEGNPVRSSVQFRNGRLSQRQIHSQGTRQNTLSLNSSASRLTMGVEIGSDQLPGDIRYRLTFRRGS